MVKTDTLIIIPFVNPVEFNNNPTKQYFIKDINIFKSNKSVIEGFDSHTITTPNNETSDTSELLTDLQESIEIDNACKVLKKQEDINGKQENLNTMKIHNLKLQKQKDEFDKLNAEITKLKETRRKQMEKEDMINIAKYQKQRGEESKLRDIALNRNKNSFNPTFNVNMIEKKG